MVKEVTVQISTENNEHAELKFKIQMINDMKLRASLLNLWYIFIHNNVQFFGSVSRGAGEKFPYI